MGVLLVEKNSLKRSRVSRGNAMETKNYSKA